MLRKCPNCSNRVVKGSKFCTHCGGRLPDYSKKKRRKVNKDFIDVDFTGGKKIFNQYKKYFLERLKDPTTSMKKSMNQVSFQFGLVQLILFALINSITVLTLHGKVNVGSTYNSNLSMFSLFFGALVLQALLFLNTVISLYISANYLKKVPTTVQTITSRIGGLITPQLILSIVLYLSVLLRIGFLYDVTLSLIILIGIVIISFYLLSIKNNSTIPNFYTVIFAMSLLLFLQVIMYNVVIRFSTNPQIYPRIISLIIG